MESIKVAVPEKVVGHVRKILHRPVVHGKGVQEEIMTKRFQSEDRALNEWVCSNEIIIVPHQLSLERGNSDDETNQDQEQTMNPRLLKVTR